MQLSRGKAPIMGLCVTEACLRITGGELNWQNRARLGRITQRVRVIPVGRGQKKALPCSAAHAIGGASSLCRRGMSQAALWLWP